jgi:hypothetical protein
MEVGTKKVPARSRRLQGGEQHALHLGGVVGAPHGAEIHPVEAAQDAERLAVVDAQNDEPAAGVELVVERAGRLLHAVLAGHQGQHARARGERRIHGQHEVGALEVGILQDRDVAFGLEAGGNPDRQLPLLLRAVARDEDAALGIGGNGLQNGVEVIHAPSRIKSRVSYVPASSPSTA